MSTSRRVDEIRRDRSIPSRDVGRQENQYFLDVVCPVLHLGGDILLHRYYPLWKTNHLASSARHFHLICYHHCHDHPCLQQSALQQQCLGVIHGCALQWEHSEQRHHSENAAVKVQYIRAKSETRHLGTTEIPPGQTLVVGRIVVLTGGWTTKGINSPNVQKLWASCCAS